MSVPHGCDGSATTKVAISMPEEIPQVTATRNPYWDLEVRSEPLAEPIEDAHGNEITEREAVVVYTAKEPLPDPDRDTFELSVQLPDAVGETFAFPIVQTCDGRRDRLDRGRRGGSGRRGARAPGAAGDDHRGRG